MLYDGECGFCRWSTHRLLAWDYRGRLRAAAIQSDEGDRLLNGMPARRRLASWHLVETDGTVRSAGDAVAPLLRRLPAGTPLAVLAELFPSSTERTYRALARRRSWLGKVLRS